MKIAKGTTFIIAGRVAGVISGFLFILIVPRVLGPEHMGYYSYWFSIFSILVLIMNFGGNQTLQRFIPELAIEDPGCIKSLLYRTALVKLVLCAVIAVLVFAVFRDTPLTALVITAGACVYSLVNLTGQFFYGLKQMDKFAVMAPLQSLGRLGCVVLFFLLWNTRGIIFGIIVSGLLYLLVYALPFVRNLSACGPIKKCAFSWYFRSGFFLFAGDVLFIIMQRLMVPISKKFVGDLAALGHLGLAFLIFQTLSTVPKSIALGLLPRVVELLKEHDSSDDSVAFDELRSIYNETWRYITVLIFPIIAGVAFLIHPAIRIFIAPSYLPAAHISFFLLPALYFASYMPLNIKYLQAHNKGLFLAGVTASICALFIVLCATATALLGTAGAALALSASLMILWFILTLSQDKYIDYKKLVISTFKSVIASISMLAAIWKIPVSGVMVLTLNIVAGACVYFLVLWLVRGITEVDIRRLIRKN